MLVIPRGNVKTLEHNPQSLGEPALVKKMEWGRADRGVQVIGVEAVEDLIPTNRWLKRAVGPGRVEAMSVPLGAGRKPRIGHEGGTWDPIRFYV